MARAYAASLASIEVQGYALRSLTVAGAVKFSIWVRTSVCSNRFSIICIWVQSVAHDCNSNSLISGSKRRAIFVATWESFGCAIIDDHIFNSNARLTLPTRWFSIDISTQSSPGETSNPSRNITRTSTLFRTVNIYEKIENMSSFIVQIFFGLQIILTKAHYIILALSHFMC